MKKIILIVIVIALTILNIILFKSYYDSKYSNKNDNYINTMEMK